MTLLGPINWPSRSLFQVLGHIPQISPKSALLGYFWVKTGYSRQITQISLKITKIQEIGQNRLFGPLWALLGKIAFEKTFLKGETDFFESGFTFLKVAFKSEIPS